jgi:small redox-active disulfide protein 2
VNNKVYNVNIGGREVGLVGLEEAFIEVRERGLKGPVELMAELLRRARRANFIPVSAEHEYCEAIYLEYRRFLGETVTEDRTLLEIRVLGPGCPRCDELERLVKNAVAEMEIAADVRHVRDLNEISKYGPLPTPCLVINGKVVTAGKVRSIGEIKRLLAET